MALVLGVDSSTQSVKVEAHEASDGTLLASAKRPHPATTPPKSEQDPQAWWEALSGALDDVLTALGGRRSEVVAISVGGQQHGMVALDENDDPVHPGKLWNDTESAPDALALTTAQEPAHWADRSGSVPVAAFTVTKLAWLKRVHPDAYARIASVLLPHDYLTFRLTGNKTTDRGDASGTGYWSPATGTWSLDLLARVDADRDWSTVVPTVVGPFDAAGVLRPDVAARFGLSEHVLVGPGTGDNMAAALGLGLRTGDVAISLGTSGTVYAVSATPTADATGAVAGFADATGNFLPLVCTLNAMKVTDAVARLLGVDHAAFEALVGATPVGAGGLSLVPYFDGERTPNRPDATGSILGIRSDVSRGQLARAAVEGVACGLLEGLDALRACGVRDDGRLFLIGGGSRSAAFRQVFADLAQRAVVVPGADEHVAQGAALQAAAVWNVAHNGHAADATALPVWADHDGIVTHPAATPEAAAAARAAYARARS